MAPALTGPAPEPDLQRMWRGEGVSPAEVMAQLGRLRRGFAHPEAGDPGHPHPRGAVMNVVALAASEPEADRAAAALRHLARHHPSRTLIVLPEPERPGGRLGAEVESHAHRLPDGGQVEYEQVLLRVPATAGAGIPSLVRPLMMPDLRTYLWWVGGAPLGDRLSLRLLSACQGLIVDSAGFARVPESFRALGRRLRGGRGGTVIGDLNWARTAPWRESLAQLFNPLERRPWLSEVTSLIVEYAGPGGGLSGAGLLVGWMASRLHWRLPERGSISKGRLLVRARGAAGQAVEVRCGLVEVAGLAPGELSSLVIEARPAGEGWTFRAERRPHRPALVFASLEQGGRRIDYVLPMEARNDVELLCHLLPEMSGDAVYGASLRAASRLLEAAG